MIIAGTAWPYLLPGTNLADPARAGFSARLGASFLFLPWLPVTSGSLALSRCPVAGALILLPSCGGAASFQRNCAEAGLIGAIISAVRSCCSMARRARPPGSRHHQFDGGVVHLRGGLSCFSRERSACTRHRAAGRGSSAWWCSPSARPAARYRWAVAAVVTAAFPVLIGVNLVLRHLLGLPPSAVAERTLGCSALLLRRSRRAVADAAIPAPPVVGSLLASVQGLPRDVLP